MITLTFKEEQKSAYCLPPGKQDRLKSFLSDSFLPINYGLASALISCAQVRRNLVLYTSCLFSDLRESKELYRRCSIELNYHGLLSRVPSTVNFNKCLLNTSHYCSLIASY